MWTLAYKVRKFGSNPYCHGWNIFSRGLFCYWRTYSTCDWVGHFSIVRHSLWMMQLICRLMHNHPMMLESLLILVVMVLIWGTKCQIPSNRHTWSFFESESVPSRTYKCVRRHCLACFSTPNLALLGTVATVLVLSIFGIKVNQHARARYQREK